jgi:divalent metal cation (Fe/Co/Zn/Cd) transporter
MRRGLDATDGVSRDRLVRRASAVSVASVVWGAVVGATTIAAGIATDSVALLTLGLGAVIDGAASAVLVWRFHVATRSPERDDHVEMTARTALAIALLVATAYVAIQSVLHLLAGSGPDASALGVVVAGASVVVLPVLATIKLGLARRIPSEAFRADGVLTATSAALAAAALLGLLLSDALGWWWADAVAALALAALLASEGARGLAGSAGRRRRTTS